MMERMNEHLNCLQIMCKIHKTNTSKLLNDPIIRLVFISVKSRGLLRILVLPAFSLC